MEMALGALYFEKGFDAVRDWVTNTYDPLITAATDALNRCVFLNVGFFLLSTFIWSVPALRSTIQTRNGNMQTSAMIFSVR
ncbi:hypothetical protein OF83DRAFT_1141092 [Amylostereum chailletii]|nr:hypothetical protein OF83DRAFT_1141092 [Amylostereum chailletii]